MQLHYAFERLISYWKFYTILFLAVILAPQVSAQPVVEWSKLFGSSSYEYANSCLQTADGGYIIGGGSESGIDGDRTEENRGSSDYWILKIAADGTKEWDKAYGGDMNDILESIQQTSDGGYILGGTSTSGISGDKSEENNSTPDPDGIPRPDYWIIKISADGTKEWDKDYGFEGEDLLRSVIQTSDGGYLAQGNSFNIKLNENGEEEWRTTPASFATDRLGRLHTPDGSYVIAKRISGGYSITKLSSNGSEQWVREYASTGQGSLVTVPSIRLTSDGGYIIGGSSNYNAGGEKTDDRKGGLDYWVIKVTADGTKQWDKTFGGSSDDTAEKIEETVGGGFLLSGKTLSGVSGDKTTALVGQYDCWVIKISFNGTMEWNRSLGSTGGKTIITLLRQVEGPGYLFGGLCDGSVGGDKSEDKQGYWMIKLAADGSKAWDKIVPGRPIGSTAPITGGYLISTTASTASRGQDFWVTKVSLEEPPLPVTLINFSAKKETNTAVLSWATTSETRSDHFEVLRSFDGKSWNKLANVNAKGESQNLAGYQYVDASPKSASNNLYRLKMVDTDGTFAYSKIVSVKFDFILTVISYPNPATEMLTLKASDWSKVNSVQILSSQGKVVYQSGKKPEQSINTKGYVAGLYFVKVGLTDESMTIQKIVIGQ